MHVLWPEALWYLAIGHASHTEEPTVDATFPESHSVHVELPSDVEYLPSVQFEHIDALVRLYFPGSHREQFTAPPVLNVPASQAEQVELPL